MATAQKEAAPRRRWRRGDLTPAPMVGPTVEAWRNPAVALDRLRDWAEHEAETAAACVAFDHFFGLSSGWMRDVGTVQALQRRLSEFRFAWITANAEHALSSSYSADVRQRLAVIERFVADLATLVSVETGEWL